MVSSGKLWRQAYTAGLVVLIAGGLLAAALDVGAFAQQTTRSLRAFLLFGLAATFGSVALFSLLEFVLPAAGPRKPLRSCLLNLKIMLVLGVSNAVLGALVAGLIVTLSNRLGLGWIDLRFSTGHGVGMLFAAFLLFALVYDFFNYWFHRFQHESFLWQQHKLHHMDEQLCAVTAFRHNWLEGWLVGSAITIPMVIVFKLDPAEGFFSFLFYAWGTFVHSNIRTDLGPLNVVFGNPQVHRIHHSRDREHHDRNYAAFFPIWDVLFGTYRHPKRGEYPVTGVDGEREIETLGEAVALPIVGWRTQFHDWRGRRVAVPT